MLGAGGRTPHKEVLKHEDFEMADINLSLLPSRSPVLMGQASVTARVHCIMGGIMAGSPPAMLPQHAGLSLHADLPDEKS